MEKALVKKSGIIKLKSKFFLNRALTYFSFLLIPLWLQKAQSMNFLFQGILMLMYVLFMCSQWYLLGKEIDHRLKIYFRANSSIDRILYRLLLGNVIILVYFNLVSLLPDQFYKHFFWGTWILLGLFYSWPTRGKIIEESVTSQLEEFKFLDSFEKTVTVLSVIMFLVTVPEVAQFDNIEALKLYFDPNELFHQQFWNFLRLNYYPFLDYPNLYSLSWSLHFYFVGLGFYLLALYGILRFFVSRRLSILGVFAVLSTWSFAKILEIHYSASISTTFSILWIWALMFSTKSSTYRAGFFIGLINFLGCLINMNFIVLFPVQLVLLTLFLMKERTRWYRRQALKYSILGGGLTLIAFFSHSQEVNMLNGIELSSLKSQFFKYIDQKSFFWLSFLGFAMIGFHNFAKNKQKFLNQVRIDSIKLNELLISLSTILVIAIFIEKDLINSFGLLWVLVFFSVFPLEWIFQSISRLRSKRNIIFVLYILICLLDSHFEGRIKIIAKMFR